MTPAAEQGPPLEQVLGSVAVLETSRVEGDGPIGRVRDDDTIEIVVDRAGLAGSVNLVGRMGRTLEADDCEKLLHSRPRHPGLAPHEHLPADSRLWAALQRAGGGASTRDKRSSRGTSCVECQSPSFCCSRSRHPPGPSPAC